MTCDRVQAELSRAMDEPRTLGSEAAAHVRTCDECGDFHATSIDLSRRYAREVRSGIDRLRRLEGGIPPRKPLRPARLLLPLAAAALLFGLGLSLSRGAAPLPPAPRVALTKISSLKPAPRARLLEDRSPFEEEVSLLFDLQPKLPLRLDQEFLPDLSERAEISLPRSLRF